MELSGFSLSGLRAVAILLFDFLNTDVGFGFGRTTGIGRTTVDFDVLGVGIILVSILTSSGMLSRSVLLELVAVGVIGVPSSAYRLGYLRFGLPRDSSPILINGIAVIVPSNAFSSTINSY
jgi:hypothetical protein